MKNWRLGNVTGYILVLMVLSGALAQKLETTPRLAVVSAFAPELGALLAETEVEATHVVHGRTFTIGTLQGHEVVLFLSGVSMVNANAGKLSCH